MVRSSKWCLNGVGMSGLVTCHAALSQQCDVVLSSHFALYIHSE
jgi:hypothetical protein